MRVDFDDKRFERIQNFQPSTTDGMIQKGLTSRLNWQFEQKGKGREKVFIDRNEIWLF